MWYSFLLLKFDASLLEVVLEHLEFVLQAHIFGGVFLRQLNLLSLVEDGTIEILLIRVALLQQLDVELLQDQVLIPE